MTKPEAYLTLQPDGTGRGGHRWEQTFAAWRSVPERVFEWTTEPEAFLPKATTDAVAHLERILADEWAHRLTDIEILRADQHADYFTRRDVVILAECRAIVLRHPNPFPTIELFRFPHPRRWWQNRKRAAA